MLYAFIIASPSTLLQHTGIRLFVNENHASSPPVLQFRPNSARFDFFWVTMANFDSDKWYQLFVASAGTSQAMVGSPIYSEGRGAVFLQITSITTPAQKWQIYTFNSSYYVLRSQGSGPQSYMVTLTSKTEDTPGSTVPGMVMSSIADDSMFWKISPWGDGTFYFSNAANGTGWHLKLKSNSLMAMDSNITAPQDGQRFTFNATTNVDDARYSSIVLSSATTTSTGISASTAPAGTSTSTPSATLTVQNSASASSNSSSKTSSNTSAIIGGVIGGVVGVLILVIGLVILRRRRLRDQVTELPRTPSLQNFELFVNDKYRGPQLPTELSVPPAELSTRNEPSELPAR